jgi:hypothetical protein
MIWEDDKKLALFSNSNSGALKGPNTYRGITIVYSTYHNRINDNHTFDTAKISKLSLDVKDAGAETDQETTKTGRRCGFSITASDGAIYDKIGMRIEASINRCNRTRDCAGMSSEFWVGNRMDGQHGVALTSATISNIPSWNRLPKGDRNNEVRGGFGESSGTELVAALGSKTIDVQYSLNFFDTILSYHIETGRIAASTEAFKACIGDGDFNWLIREKTKSGSPVQSDK